MVTLRCEHCGQTYERTQRRINGALRRYCSIACRSAAWTRPLETFYREDAATGCWNWTGVRHRGYGLIMRKAFNGRVPVRAARLFYERVNGPIPPGLTVEHLCKNPPCVNPAHLTLLTASENARRARQKPACGQCGGAWRQTRSGVNYCPACINRRARAYRARAKVA